MLSSSLGDLNLVSSANKETFPETVNLHVVLPAPSVKGLLQKKNVRPSHSQIEIKSVNSALSVNQCLFAPNVTNAPCVAKDPPVGGRLQLFWQVWLSLGSNPRVVSILREGYQLPFKERPPLARFPVIISGSSNPSRNKSLNEALHSLGQKQTIEKVSVQSSLGFYNRLFLVPKPNGKWRPILDLSQLNLYLAPATFKMETPETIRLSLQQGEWVTSLDFSDAYFHIPINHRSRKYLRFHLKGQTFQFTALPFGLSTAPLEFTKVVKEVKLMAQSRGIRIHQYLDDWLLRAPCREICLRHTQILLPLARLGSQHGQVRAGSPTNLRLRRLSFQPISGVSQTNSGQVEESISEAQPSPGTGMLHSQAVHVFNRPSDSNRKTSSVGAAAYEAHSVAPKKALACPGIAGKGHPNSFISPCTSKVVVGPGQGALRSTLTPSSTRPSTVYRRLKRRLGRSLRRLHGKRSLVRVRKRLAHKFVGAQGGPAGLKTFRAVMLQPDSSCLYRQHHCGLLHQQGRGYEIRLTLCPPLETDALVQSKADCLEGQAYSGSPERHSRQAVPTQSGDPNRMVPPPGGVCSNMPALAPPVCGPVCHPVQSQTSPVCIPGSRPISVGSGRLKSPLGGPGRLCLSTDGPSSSGGNETLGPRIPSSHSDSTRLAQHALVLGPGQHVSSSSPPAPSGVEIDHSTVQSVSSPGPAQSEPSCVAPRASAIQQAGFSAEVATRIEAPQRRSTRAIYESKWSVFVRWCEKNQVDFRTPSIEQIADFLLSLFQEKHLQPSTIEGYRTAIADKVGNSRINISKDENLSRLLDSFHRDKPKGRRGVPTWNLSLVLHQLTQPPFEPLRKASLKYLTFKTVFLLALGSGKRRSEIHAWVHRNIRRQEDWSNVSLSPSPSFISKNHLAKEGPACVAPVIIPALAPSLDKSLKEDRSLCPVRALRYYLDKTKDLRSGKELVFVSFRKSFQKDIVPATVSSWIKQTIVLCYQMSDQQAQQLHQVRAHDVRAFAASKAFQGGVPLDQILAACHWKSHNTFTQFYLKDLAWADSDVYHLGPVVAAQQIRD